MARRTGASMVPLDEQMTQGGRGTRVRRDLKQRLIDAQNEINNLKWGGVKDAAATLFTVLEVLEDDEKTAVENIHNQIVELLREKGQEVGV
jgi:hypothetical protein